MRAAIWRGRRGTRSDAIRLVDICNGAEFDLDLTRFPEAEPVFAYFDDYRCRVRALTGLVVGGQVTIEIPQEVHPHAPTRSCVLLKASRECRQGSVATFLSLAVGEFDLEVYRLSPEGAVELLFADDFIFK